MTKNEKLLPVLLLLLTPVYVLAQPLVRLVSSLDISAISADIAPDGSFVAVQSRVLDQREGKVRHVVTVWNFQNGRTVAIPILERAAERGLQGELLDLDREPTFVRVTPDSKSIVAYIDGVIFFLRSEDLTTIRTFATPLPDPVQRSYIGRTGSHTYFDRTKVQVVELSPDGTLIALLMARNVGQPHVAIYDLGTGKLVSEASVKYFAEMDRDSGLTWNGSSSILYVAARNALPCAAHTSDPDVFGFDARTGVQKASMTSGVLVADIAFTPENQLLAVDGNCVGVFTNHHPKLHVLNAETGKKLHSVEGRPAVRYRVAVSRNGRRAVAWTSEVRCSFDASDMACGDEAVRNEFSAWSLPDYKLVGKSGPIPTSARALRISADGRYLLTYTSGSLSQDKPNVSVFELP